MKYFYFEDSRCKGIKYKQGIKKRISGGLYVKDLIVYITKLCFQNHKRYI